MSLSGNTSAKGDWGVKSGMPGGAKTPSSEGSSREANGRAAPLTKFEKP